MTGVTTRPFTFDVCAKDSAKTSVLLQWDPWETRVEKTTCIAGKVQSARKPDATCIRLTDSSCQDLSRFQNTNICAASSVDQLCTQGVSWLNCLYSSHLLPFLSQWSQRVLAEAPVYVMWTFSHLLLTLLTSWGTGWHGSVSI